MAETARIGNSSTTSGGRAASARVRPAWSHLLEGRGRTEGGYNPAMNDAAVEHGLRIFFQTGAPEVTAAYLFGCVARGRSRATSDIDVGVLLTRPPAATLGDLPLDLETDLERLLGVPVQG